MSSFFHTYGYKNRHIFPFSSTFLQIFTQFFQHPSLGICGKVGCFAGLDIFYSDGQSSRHNQNDVGSKISDNYIF